MNIQEAVKKAIEEDKYIIRASFPVVKIATFVGIPCVIMSRDGSGKKTPWHPTQGDLLADDWMVCV